MAKKPEVKFEWKGMEELKKNLREVGLALADSQPEVKDIIMGPARAWQAEARSLAPFRTGDLRESIYVRRAKRGVLIGTKIFYARFVEFGTSKMAPKPFFRPAFLKMGSTYVADIAPGVKKLIEETAAKGAHHPPK